MPVERWGSPMCPTARVRPTRGSGRRIIAASVLQRRKHEFAGALAGGGAIHNGREFVEAHGWRQRTVNRTRSAAHAEPRFSRVPDELQRLRVVLSAAGTAP